MMGLMSGLTDAVGGEDLLVGFPSSGVEDWVACAEVMLLEGIRAWVLPVTLIDLVPEVVSLYGFRARIGLGGVTTVESVVQAREVGVHFLTSPILDPALREAAQAVPLIPGALTPGEVHEAVNQGFDAVQVVPAHVMGSAYARTLPGLVPDVGLMATGRIERYQADMWRQAGAAAVCTEGIILHEEGGTGGAGNEPAEVRRRCQNFTQAQPQRG